MKQENNKGRIIWEQDDWPWLMLLAATNIPWIDRKLLIKQLSSTLNVPGNHSFSALLQKVQHLVLQQWRSFQRIRLHIHTVTSAQWWRHQLHKKPHWFVIHQSQVGHKPRKTSYWLAMERGMNGHQWPSSQRTWFTARSELRTRPDAGISCSRWCNPAALKL